MLKLLMIHIFRKTDDGAFIRVKNLNLTISEITDAECLEIVLVSLRHFRDFFRNENNSRIFRRRLILPIIWTNRHLIARIWNNLSSWLVGLLLSVLYQPDIIVGETSASWRLARAVKFWRRRSRLIIDLHGAVPEEISFHYSPSKRLNTAVRQENEFERDIILNSDFVTCQSVNMISHLLNKYPNVHAKIHSFQCSVQSKLFRFDLDKRSYIRKKLDLQEDEVLFVYCGSFHKWQNVQYSVEIFAEYLKVGDSSAVLLIMSPSPGDDIFNYALSLGLNEHNLKIQKVLHEEVPDYLSAADIGFLIRDDSVVNFVASPTKLGEYLACGLSVIVGHVAQSWPPAMFDSSCFCYVDLNDANRAANAICYFLKKQCKSKVLIRDRAVSIADYTLSNIVETENLKIFLKNKVLVTV